MTKPKSQRTVDSEGPPPWDPSDVSVLKQIYPKLRAFAATVGSREMQPDDLVQEAITRMFARTSFRSIEHPEAYLRRSIYHLAVDGTRRRHRFESLTPKLVDSEGHSDHYPSDMEGLFALKPPVRALLYACLIDGTPIETAAADLGMTSTAARVAIHRAKKVLRANSERSDHE